MKRKITALILLILCFAMTTQALGAQTPTKVVDQAGLLSAEESLALTEQAETMTSQYETDVVILTVDSLGDKDAQTFADDYFDDQGYGVGPSYSGILLLISMEARDWAMSTCGETASLVTDADLALLEDAMLPHLGDGQYFAAFTAYLQELDRVLSAPVPSSTTPAQNGTVHTAPNSNHAAETSLPLLQIIGVALVLGVLSGGITVAVLRRGMNTARAQAAAGNYVEPQSFQLTQSRDIYLYSHTTRQRRQTENQIHSGSSGGSYHHGGSTTHSGSSGRSHGGSHGKF